MKIRFTEDFRPKGDASDIPSYSKGEEYTFAGATAEGYARKYIDRGLAVEVKDEPAPRASRASAVKVSEPTGTQSSGQAGGLLGAAGAAGGKAT